MKTITVTLIIYNHGRLTFDAEYTVIDALPQVGDEFEGGEVTQVDPEAREMEFSDPECANYDYYQIMIKLPERMRKFSAAIAK